MAELEARDRELLALLQTEVPLASTPYAIIGQAIDMSEKEVIKRTDRLKRDGVIRRIAGLFDGRMLGYRTSLVAARVDPDRVEQSAAAINLHPAVTQNYQRNHEFNIWFTISLPPDSRLGLERTVDILAGEAQSEATRLLPTLKLLKGSTTDLAESSPNESGTDEPHEERAALTDSEIDMIRLLQHDLPAEPRPFETLASLAGVSGEELLAVARTFAERQQLRRFAAVIDSRKPSFSATTMGVWQVDPSGIDAFGALVADVKAVSHCYVRPVYPDWPFNVFTTVHGRSVGECEAVLDDIAGASGVTERAALFPTRELKRTRVSYFSPEVGQWESSRTEDRSASAAS